MVNSACLLRPRRLITWGSFCRKTTLTKHFRRWHTDEETSSEEGSDVGPEEIPEDGTMTRQSSNYYGDLWPLPGQSAPPARSASFQTKLVSRPKSTESSMADRPSSTGSRPGPIHTNATMSSFEYVKSRTGIPSEQIGLQTTMLSTMNDIPISQQYTAENGIGTWTASMANKASPTAFTPYPSEPGSAQSNVFYLSGSSTPHYSGSVVDIPLSDSVPFSDDRSPAVASPADPMLHGSLNRIAPPLQCHGIPVVVDSPLQFVSTPTTTPQQPAIPEYPNSGYVIPDRLVQYYQQPAPEWLISIKPEETWAGCLPSQIPDFNWN